MPKLKDPSELVSGIPLETTQFSEETRKEVSNLFNQLSNQFQKPNQQRNWDRIHSIAKQMMVAFESN